MIYENMDWEKSLKDMFFNILYGWKKIIIVAVCAGFFGGGIFGFRLWYNAEKINDSTSSGDIFSEYEEKIVSCENRVKELEAAIKSQEEYLDNSTFMKIDYYNTAKASASIYASSKEGNSTTILGLYAMLVCDDGFLDVLETELDPDDNYIDELLSITYDEAKILSISVVHSNEAEAEKILDFVLNEMESNYLGIEAMAGKHEFHIIHKLVHTELDEDVLEKQKNEKKRITEMEAALISAKSELNSLQNSQDLTTLRLISTVITGFALGLVLGVFVSSTYFACKYLFGNVVYSAEEIRKRLGVVHLGSILVGKRHDKLSAAFRKLEGRILTNSEDNLDLIAERVRVYNGDNKTVLLTGCAKENDIRRIAEELQNKLPDIKVDFCGSILDKAEYLRTMRNNESVVLVETCEKSNYNDMIQELELIQESKVKLVGCIVIEQV